MDRLTSEMTQKLTEAFITLGYRFEMKRLSGKSLSSEDRNIASSLQQKADAFGWSKSLRNSCIIEGEYKARVDSSYSGIYA